MALAGNARAALAALLGISAYESPAPSAAAPSASVVETIRRAMGGQLQPVQESLTRPYMGDIESAERNADNGDLRQAAMLMRAARKDGVLAGVLSTRTGGIVGLPKRFRGEPEIVASLEYGHQSIRSVFDEMCPAAELSALAADGIFLGVAVAELVPVEGRDYPVLVRLDPAFLTYRWSENRWYFNSIAGALPITPGDGRWVLHVPGGRMSPWQHGLWRAVARAYVRKEQAALKNDNWQGKLANPARIAVAPAGATEEQTDEWFQRVMGWGINTVFGMRPGYDVRLLESNGRGYESFLKTIADQNQELIIAVAGQTVTTDGGTGFANADVHKSIRADLIKETADGLAYTVNTQVIPPYVLERWGIAGLQVGAQVGWDVTPPKDRSQEANSLVAIASAIKGLDEALAAHAQKLDVAAVCAKYGVPVLHDVDGDGVPDAETEPAKLSVVKDAA